MNRDNLIFTTGVFCGVVVTAMVAIRIRKRQKVDAMPAQKFVKAQKKPKSTVILKNVPYEIVSMQSAA